MLKSRYNALPQDDNTACGRQADRLPSKVTKTRSRVVRLWPLACILSICLNGFLLVGHVQSKTCIGSTDCSDSSLGRLHGKVSIRDQLANLDQVGFRDSLDIPFPNRNYSLENDPLLEDPRFSLERGFVAVDMSVAETHGFPRAQPWPWDEMKGIYLLNSWHNLHCVIELRKSIKSAFEGSKQDDQGQKKHLLHCLHILGDDILCAADDTLRYTGPLYEQVSVPVPHSGLGQKRKCRNWDELYDWAMQNSACYNDKRDQPNLPELERYKFCPDGTEPWNDAH